MGRLAEEAADEQELPVSLHPVRRPNDSQPSPEEGLPLRLLQESPPVQRARAEEVNT